jgi:hypothetical protein
MSRKSRSMESEPRCRTGDDSVESRSSCRTDISPHPKAVAGATFCPEAIDGPSRPHVPSLIAIVRHLVLLVAFVSLVAPTAHAQVFTGVKSLITIPTAEMPRDGEVTFSGAFVNRKHTTYQEGRYHYTPFSASVGFLPFVETSFRLSRAISPQPQALGDRMFMVRVRVLEGSDRWPSIVVGAHDFIISTESLSNKFAASYVVASHDLQLGGHELMLTLGYGADLIRARMLQFEGVFGGVRYAPHPRIAAAAEYDGARPNVGLMGVLPFGFQVGIATQNFDTVIAGLSFSIVL